jgi:hypothetical protein
VATLAVVLPSTALAKPHAKEFPLEQFAVPADLWYASDSFAAVGRIDSDG